ncbi:hypothetical protein ACPV4X_26465 [Vibrio owensii]|uniref:hypothetical protein n=1 Tax=Vibrio owensii TaxID=696485 RepID=UPI004069142C
MKQLSNGAYISDFEDNFENWVETKSRLFCVSGGKLQELKAPIQALVNAYHDERGELSPAFIPNFNTLKLFISISGASVECSNDNESLSNMEVAKPIVENKG